MTQYTQITIIVPAETAQTYRDLAASLHPAGAGMFTTPLYTGEDITHYISTGKIDVEFVECVTRPDVFAGVTGVSVETAQALQEGVCYFAVGEGDEVPAMHGLEAIGYLGLSLTPSREGGVRCRVSFLS